MRYDTVTTELRDKALLVTLSRPEKLNAYTAHMGLELAQVFTDANENDEVRVIIVTGEGRGFCAGADLSAGASSFGSGAEATFGADAEPGADTRWVDAIFNCLKPSIAAINGPAIGVGFTMTLPMDMRICSTEARFGPTFAKLGLFPEAGAAWFLPRVVGAAQATQWCLMAEIFGAEEALRGRLVSEVVEPGALLDRAFEIAERISTNTSAISAAVTRQLFLRCSNLDDPVDLLMLDSRLNREAGFGGDVSEGIAAMLERRPPQFPGKVTRDMPPSFPW